MSSRRDTALTASLLLRVTLRHWRSAPVSTLALIFLIALGVASFVSIQLANRSALQSFRQFTNLVSGASDFVVTHASGRFTNDEVAALRVQLDSQPLHLIPVIESSARDAQYPERRYTLLGADLASLANVDVRENARAEGVPTAELWRETRGTPAAWVSENLRKRHQSGIPVRIGGVEQLVPIAGLVPRTADAPETPDDLLLFDLPLLQDLLHRPNDVDRVEVIAESGPNRNARVEEARKRILEGGQGRWLISTAENRREAAETMTAAFRLNLTVLSLIALLVGLYLIRQSLEGAVVRRRAETATLRALGVSPARIRALWIAESAAIGVAGGALGVALGWLAAQGTVRAVGETVNALYFKTTAAAATLGLSEILLGVAAGTLACVFAAWKPASEAACTPPAQLLAQRSAAPVAKLGARAWIPAIGCIVLACVCSRLPGIPLASGARFPLGGYAASFFAIVGTGLLAAPLLAGLGAALHRLRQNSAPLRLATSYLERPSPRHAIASAGLVCAIAMTAGMAILVSSFERSVRGWIEQSLRADLYVTYVANMQEGHRRFFTPAFIEDLKRRPGVEAVFAQVYQPIILNGRSTQVVGADKQSILNEGSLLWRDRPPALVAQADSVTEAWISESFGSRFSCDVGSKLTLPTPSGPLAVVVTAVYSDYGNERGSIWIDKNVFHRLWMTEGGTHLSFKLQSPEMERRLRQDLTASTPGLAIFDNRSLRAEVLRVFRQTFSITYALEVLGVGVALASLALTLASLTFERKSELTTLRSLGFRRKELANLVGWEGMLMAATATALGLFLSFFLGWLLVYVINKQSFGWTLQWQVPGVALALLGTAVIATGWFVAWLIGRRTAAIGADREE